MAKSTRSGTIIPFPTSGMPDKFPSSAEAGSEEESLRLLEETIDQMVEDFTIAEEAMTLALIYLDSMFARKNSRQPFKTTTGFRYGTLAKLQAQGLIDVNTKKNTITVTEDGLVMARQTAHCLATLYGQSLEIARKPVPTFTFLLDLDLDGRPCTRLMRVPHDLTFKEFHEVIQDAFGWMDYHLYDFRLTHNKQKVVISDPSRDAVDGMFSWLKKPDDDRVDAGALTLEEVFPRTRSAKYCYDYGDSWEVAITYKGSGTHDHDVSFFCEGGEGDAPPEDVGGIGGFERFLSIIANPKDPEYNEMVEWGESQGYHHFHVDELNAVLLEGMVSIYGV